MTKKLRLEHFLDITENLEYSRKRADFSIEACIWCLKHNNHSINVELIVDSNLEIENKQLIWDEESFDMDIVTKSNQPNQAVEFGAELITMCIISEYFSDYTFEKAEIGTGIDYWLKKKEDSSNFDKLIYNDIERKIRVEVSGILSESKNNTVKHRSNIKREQSENSDNSNTDVIISIVEFGKPQTKIECYDVSKRST